MTFHAYNIDEASRRYLRKVDRQRGAKMNGVYIRKSGSGVVGYYFLLLVSCSMLFLAVYLCRPSDTLPSESPIIPVAQTVLSTLGIYLFFKAIAGVYKRGWWRGFGAFVFADALQVWEVGLDDIRVTPLNDLAMVEARKIYSGNDLLIYYQHSTVELTFPDATENIVIQDEKDALELAKFLQALVDLRNDYEDRSDTPPEMFGAMACQISSSIDGDVEPSNASVDIPRSVTDVKRTSMLTDSATPSLAAVLVFAIGFFGFRWLNERIYQESYYQEILASTDNTLKIEFYLDVCPNGVHVDKVRALKDDRLFEIAKEDSTGDNGFLLLREYLDNDENSRHRGEAAELLDDRQFELAKFNAANESSPRFLRYYLEEPENTRHREEAKSGIAKFYDRAMNRLHDLADNDATDLALHSGLIAVLEDLKSSNEPVIKVGFHGQQDAQPTTDEQRQQERIAYAFHLSQDANLRELADKSSTDVIIGAGDTFDEQRTEFRHRVMLGRIRSALLEVLDADLLTLELAEEREQPAITIQYHIYPSGLYKYTSSQGSDRVDSEQESHVKGLLRDYRTEWNISIKPKGQGEQYEWNVESEANSTLN